MLGCLCSILLLLLQALSVSARPYLLERSDLDITVELFWLLCPTFKHRIQRSRRNRCTGLLHIPLTTRIEFPHDMQRNIS